MLEGYISREAALKAANEWVNEACMAPVMRVSRLFDKLQKVPAADVAEVVYGQWEGEGDGYADGEIVLDVLRLQPQFTLQESYITETGERIRAVRYTADFSYKFGGKLVVEDVKSKPTRTKEYLRNRKFMRSKFGIDIQEI